MSADDGSRADALAQTRITRLFRWHAWAYGVLMGGLAAVNIYVGGGWWSFWPMCGWGLILALHFFYYKSVTVDEEWAQERTDDLKLRSYDLSHIQDIGERVDEGDASVSPPSQRKD
jgi:hypothetical protein